LIFYDNGSYTTATATVTSWRHLEAAPKSTEWTVKQWSSHETSIGGTGTDIRTGKNNTNIIVDAISGEKAVRHRYAMA